MIILVSISSLLTNYYLDSYVINFSNKQVEQRKDILTLIELTEILSPDLQKKGFLHALSH